jgi:hypothetical protein
MIYGKLEIFCLYDSDSKIGVRYSQGYELRHLGVREKIE